MRRLAAIVLLFSLLLVGCSLVKARPAKTTPFLHQPEQMKAIPERSPLNATWYKDRESYYALKSTYEHIYIAPVRTDIFENSLPQSWSDRKRAHRIQEARLMAAYLQKKCKDAIIKRGNYPLSLVEQVEPKTLILELSIADLKPTRPLINSIGTAADAFIPGTGTIKLAGSGSIAIEGIVRDGKTGEALVKFKDRESDKLAPFSFRDFKRYSHARHTAKEWASILAELIETPYEHQVKGLSPITINPF